MTHVTTEGSQDKGIDHNDLMKMVHLCLTCGKNNVKILEMGWGGRNTKGEDQCAMTTKTKCPDCDAIGHISNAVPWRGYELSEEKLRAIFVMAGIKIIGEPKKLQNGYWNVPGAYPWWFVKTHRGYIEIGWRKNVISINWSDTDVRVITTDENVTKSETYVHAWSEENAIKYLTAFAQVLNNPKYVIGIQRV